MLAWDSWDFRVNGPLDLLARVERTAKELKGWNIVTIGAVPVVDVELGERAGEVVVSQLITLEDLF